MKHFVDKGNTLLVDGPASVNLLSGRVNVLGAPLHTKETFIVREGKRLPLWVMAQSSFDLTLGKGSCIIEVEQKTVPSLWNEAAKRLLSLEKPVTVLVIGGQDSGKTSFCTFLANKAVLNMLKTAVIDADLGQSDVGPPSTIGFNFVTEPVKDLFDIDAQDAVFVGSTSPSGAMHKVIDGLVKQKSKAMEVGADFLIINTDGWVEGENAARYKKILTKTVIPSAVVGIQRTRELVPIFAVLDSVCVLFVHPPPLIRPRSREKRKRLRELGYKKYLKNARMRSLSFHWLEVQCSSLGTGVPLNHSRLGILVNLLRARPLYSEETADVILVVFNKNRTVAKEHISDAEDYFGKRVKVILDGEEKGLLMGLKDEEDRFLGVGILYGIDYKRNLLKIYTPVSEKVQRLCFGQIKLDKNCREIGLSTIFSNYFH